MKTPLFYLSPTIIILILITSPMLYAKTISCPKGIVKQGDTSKTILAKCGKPNEKIKLKSNYRLDYWPKGKKQEWVYHLGKNKFKKHLFIIDNKLALIEQGKRQH